MTIGGVIVVVIVLGAITYLNSGRGQPAVSAGPGATATAGPTGEAPSGSYRVIFEGTATGHQDRPNNSQAYAGQDATATWHLEFTVNGPAPSPPVQIVSGNGTYKVYSGTSACTATAAKFIELQPILVARGEGTYRVTPPIAFDMQSAAGCDPSSGQGDPFYTAFGAWCPPPGTTGDSCSEDLAAFEVADFTIGPGQTGTVVTNIPTKSFEYTTAAGNGTVSGNHSKHSWQGSVTVVALP